MRRVRFVTSAERQAGAAQATLANEFREKLRNGQSRPCSGLRGKGVRNLIAARAATESEAENWVMCDVDGIIGCFAKVVSSNTGDDEVWIQRLQQLDPKEDPLCLGCPQNSRDSLIKVHPKHIKSVKMRSEFGDRLRVVESKSVLAFVNMISRRGQKEHSNGLIEREESTESVVSLDNTVNSDDDDARTICDNVSEVSSLFQQLARGDDAGGGDTATAEVSEANRHRSESPLTIFESVSDDLSGTLVQPSPGLTRETPHASPMSNEVRPPLHPPAPLQPRERRRMSHGDGVAGSVVGIGAYGARSGGGPSPQCVRDSSKLEESFGTDSPLIVVKQSAPNSAGSAKSYGSISGGDGDSVNSLLPRPRFTSTPSPLLGGGIFANPEAGMPAGTVSGETPKLPVFSSNPHPPPGPGVYRAQPAAAARRAAIFGDTFDGRSGWAGFDFTAGRGAASAHIPAPAPLPRQKYGTSVSVIGYTSGNGSGVAKVLLGGCSSGFSAPQGTGGHCPSPETTTPTTATNTTITDAAAILSMAGGGSAACTAGEGSVRGESGHKAAASVPGGEGTRQDAGVAPTAEGSVAELELSDNEEEDERERERQGDVSTAAQMRAERGSEEEKDEKTVAVIMSKEESKAAANAGAGLGSSSADSDDEESLMEEETEGESEDEDEDPVEEEKGEENGEGERNEEEHEDVVEASDEEDEGAEDDGHDSWVYSLRDKQGRRVARGVMRDALNFIPSPAERSAASGQSNEGHAGEGGAHMASALSPEDAAAFGSDLSSIGVVDSSPDSSTGEEASSSRSRSLKESRSSRDDAIDTSLGGTDKEDSLNTSVGSVGEGGASDGGRRSAKKRRMEGSRGTPPCSLPVV